MDYRRRENKKFLDSYVMSIVHQLVMKTITVDEALSSIKYKFTVITPVEDGGYRFILTMLRELYEQITLESTEDVKEAQRISKSNHEEFYHKLNIELLKLTEQEKWVGVFHSQDHYKAFKYVLESFHIEEHNKTLFIGFFREYGGNKVLIRCNETKWRKWVNEHYLIKGEDSSKRWNECPQHHYTRKQIRQYQKTYKDPNIFKQPYARNKDSGNFL